MSRGVFILSNFDCNKLIVPECSSYDRDRQVFNRSIQKYPGGILYCERAQDAVRGICHAAEEGLTVQVRSGGHNYEGFCVGNGGLTIDTSRMKSMEICEALRTVSIGSGVSNAELYRFLGRRGYPFPSGTCPTVSAAGLTQGGGWGHSARMFGLACDSLLEATVADASGKLLRVNRYCHPELFWALRGGGGGNFGVLTGLTYRLPPKCDGVIYVEINYPAVSEPLACRFLKVWQQWLCRGDRRFTPNSRIQNTAANGMRIYLRGFYYGSAQRAQQSLRSFLELTGAEASFRSVSFLEATEIDASFYPDSERFRFAGRFAYEAFSDGQIHDLLRLIRNRPQGVSAVSIALYALGGQVCDADPRSTAFYYRKAGYITGIEAVWERPSAEPAALSWMQRRFPCLRAVTCGSYINFPYLETDGYMHAYYGGNATRLSSVKRKYDPCGLFRFPQSILPSWGE